MKVIFMYMIVCHCRGVNHHRVLDVVERGARSLAEVGWATGAGTCCGGCNRAIEDLIREATGDGLVVAAAERAA
jgi:bacterioferritin-associated ferredoxin